MLDWASIRWELNTYTFIFCSITAMVLISRGLSTVKWTKGLTHSALVNIGMLKFNSMFGIVFFLPLVLVNYLYDAMNLPTLSSAFWEALPAPLTWFLLLLVYDISLYWIHRWMHSGWMWPMHAVHHSDENLHFTSWSRGHALEQGLIASFLIITSTWLGLSISEIGLLAFIKALHQYYVHSNIDWNHGPFKKIIASPQYHRWHHADVKAAYDKNFASIFPFLDIIFGTYYYPHSAVNVPTGFPDSPKNDFVALILYPFTEWYRMIKAKRSGTAEVSVALEASLDAAE